MVLLFLLLVPLAGFCESWKLDAAYLPQFYSHKQTGDGLEFDNSTGVMTGYMVQVTKKVRNWRLLADYHYSSLTIETDDGERKNVSIQEIHAGAYYKRWYIGYELTSNPYFFENDATNGSVLAGHWWDVGYRLPLPNPHWRLEARGKYLISDAGSDSEVKSLSGYGGNASVEYWNRLGRRWLWNVKGTYQARSFTIESNTGDEELMTTQFILSAGLGVLF